LPLEVHALLADVPLRDVTAIDLPGGGPSRTIADVRALLPERGVGQTGNWLTRALFRLRFGLGRLFGWDRPEPPEVEARASLRRRLPPDLVMRSQVVPGTPDGFFRVMYVLEREMLVETRNATVHAFLASVLVPRAEAGGGAGGYRLYWAVYVLRRSWLTPLYMALIEPFRRFVVYPSLFRRLHAAWCGRYVARGTIKASSPRGA
jgi:hypothetical protein